MTRLPDGPEETEDAPPAVQGECPNCAGTNKFGGRIVWCPCIGWAS